MIPVCGTTKAVSVTSEWIEANPESRHNCGEKKIEYPSGIQFSIFIITNEHVIL